MARPHRLSLICRKAASEPPVARSRPAMARGAARPAAPRTVRGRSIRLAMAVSTRPPRKPGPRMIIGMCTEASCGERLYSPFLVRKWLPWSAV